MLIDEVDSILDILASHRFSVGHRKMLHPAIVDAAVGLFRILADDPEIYKHVKIPFSIHHDKSATPFSRENYTQWIKERLIRRVCNDESASHFFDSNSDRMEFKNLDKIAMANYFHSNSKEKNDNYIRKLPSDKMRDVLSVLFTEIHQVLPLTLDKSFLVHYGLCTVTDEEVAKLKPGEPPPCSNLIAVPYHSGSPALTSRFGTDLESLNYTIQSHLEKHDVSSMFRTEFNLMQAEFRRTRSPVSKRTIQEYVGNLIDGQILNMPEDELAKHAKQVSQNPDLALKLVKKYAAPKIEVYNDQLFTNSHIYPVIFAKIQGMTGTLWNYESYPEFFKKRYESDAMARTLTALWKTMDTRKVRVIDIPVKPSIPDLLQALQTVSDHGIPSIIDQGGFFRGQDNQKVAEGIIALSENSQELHLPIKQIIFYDTKHELQLLKRDHPGSFSVRPYVVQDVNRFESGAFWDLQHTTGSDLKVHPQMRAILTLNKFSILRDLIQSSWRLREIEEAQTVMVVVTHDDVKVMSKLLEEVYGPEAQIVASEDGTIPFESVLLYLATNEAKKVGEVNYRSVKASQRAIVVDTIFDALVDSPVGNQLFHSFSKVEKFFSNPKAEHPYQTYGVPMVESSTLDYLIQEINRVFDPVNNLFQNFQKLKDDFAVSLKKKMTSLRKFVVTAAGQNNDGDEEIEVEAENEQEQEQEQEEELEVERYEINPNYAKASVRWSLQNFHGNLFIGKSLGNKTTELTSLEVNELSPVLTINDILNKRTNLFIFSGIFDARLYGSLNLFPVFQTNYIDNDREFTPFGLYQGIMDYLLIQADKKGHTIQSLTLVTRDEALGELGGWLQNPSVNFGDSYFLIYQFGNGIVRASDGLLNPENDPLYRNLMTHLELNGDYRKLFVQAKFLSGRIDYSEVEQDQLKAWMGEHSKNQKLLLELLSRILEYKEDTRKELSHSHLYQILNLSQMGNEL